MPFLSAPPKHKILRYNLTKYVQDLHKEFKEEVNKCKEFKEEVNKCTDIPCSWIGRPYCQDVSTAELDL